MQVRQMVKETKIVHVQIADASEADIKQMSKILNMLKEKLTYDVEFIITNEKFEIHDIKHLINILYELYKKDKENKK